jgi:DNA-binding transcriptional ArsR family regulator
MERHLTALKALSDETRLRILGELINNELCGKALAARLDISEAAVSQHMRVLREAGLVNGTKRGYWTHYSINRETLVKISEELQDIAGSIDPTGNCRRISARKMGRGGNEVKTMCKPCCERPEKLKGRLDGCTPQENQGVPRRGAGTPLSGG